MSDAPGLGTRLDPDRLMAAHELCRAEALSGRDDAIGMRYVVEDREFNPERPCLVG